MNKYIIAIVIFSFFSCSRVEEKKTDNNNENSAIQSDKTSAKAKINNPIVTNVFTADPAALVYNDSVYIYAGHDEAPNDFHFYKMNEWLVFSSADMVNWKSHPVPLKVTDFDWAASDAWASEAIEKDGKFYWYITTTHKTIQGKAIGVAVADNPLGPFKDALGKALVTNDMTKATDIDWDDIDPTVFTDHNGQSYIFWGNTVCYYAKLKDNMIELESEIKTIELPNFTEAPYIHKRGNWYYLSYAYQFPEKIAYSMSKSINGPWEYKGTINELAGNSNTNHQSIIEFKGKSYFIYHTGGIQPNGGSFRRSVCVDRLYYNEDGTIKRVIMTSEGIQEPQN